MDAIKLARLRNDLKRIFVLPISKLTFSECFQAIINATEGNLKDAQELMNVILSAKDSKNSSLQQLIEEYSLKIQMAKEVLEKGDFINFLMSSIVSKDNPLLFSSSFRKIDGTQFQFFNGVQGILEILRHFTDRLTEIKDHPEVKSQKEEFQKILKRLEEITS